MLDEYAAQIVRKLPNPPRAVSIRAILAQMYRTNEARWMVGLGLILGLPVTIVAAFVAEGELLARVVLLAIVVPTTVMLLGTPAFASWRLAGALASGIRVHGEIVKANWQDPGTGVPTIAAAAYGMTRGTRRVHHPAGQFSEPFESDSAWSPALKPGTQVTLLAHPTERRVFFDLGPTEEGGTDE